MTGKTGILPILKLFLSLYASVLFLMTGLGLLNTLLSLRLSMEGVSEQTTGMVLTAYFIGLTVGTFFCRRIIRSVGHIRAYAAFAAVGTAMVMIHGLYISAPLWLGLRFVSGVVNMGLFMVIESWLNECAEFRVRGRVFSIYMIMTYLGSSIGQKLLGFGQVETQTLYLVVGIFLVFSIIPVTVTRSIHPRLPKTEKIRFKTILSKAPIGMSGCFTAGMLNSAFYAMGPVFAHKINLDISHLSWFMTLTILGGAILPVAGGRAVRPAGPVSDAALPGICGSRGQSVCSIGRSEFSGDVFRGIRPVRRYAIYYLSCRSGPDP